MEGWRDGGMQGLWLFMNVSFDLRLQVVVLLELLLSLVAEQEVVIIAEDSVGA